jgi:tRNA G18 (ribose-2'-O)-methylase SpoU
MSDAQKGICDEFVYIPQYGNGTASLNVNVATALVLHNFVEGHMNQEELS